MQIDDENKPRHFKVRGGFTLHRGDSVHHAGEVVKMPPDEALSYAHMIEPVENVPPPYVEPKIAPDQRKRK